MVGTVTPAMLSLPASMAGLPGKRAMVWVGPPLSWSGPSNGSIGVVCVPTWLLLVPLVRLPVSG